MKRTGANNSCAVGAPSASLQTSPSEQQCLSKSSWKAEASFAAASVGAEAAVTNLFGGFRRNTAMGYPMTRSGMQTSAIVWRAHGDACTKTAHERQFRDDDRSNAITGAMYPLTVAHIVNGRSVFDLQLPRIRGVFDGNIDGRVGNSVDFRLIPRRDVILPRVGCDSRPIPIAREI